VFHHEHRGILLVEDEPLNARIQQELLERNGLAVRVVHTGEEAIALFQESSSTEMPLPDIILMDIDLGRGINGIETAERILSRHEVPIVFITGLADQEQVRAIRRVTRYGYVLKGTDGHVLIEVIALALELFATQRQLREQERLYHLIHDATPIGIGVVTDRVIEHINDRVCTVTGYCHDELVGKSVRTLYATKEEFDRVGREKYRQIAERGVGTVETTWCRKDGAVIDVELTSAPLDPRNQRTSHTFAVVDITARKQARRELTAALADKSRLMTELNHRVKNNLLLVASLICLKDDNLGDSADLSDLRSRVEAIQIVHEKLTVAEDALEIGLADYLPDLVHAVLRSAPTSVTPRISTEIEAITLPASTAVSLGLITNELMTNAMKYAFDPEFEAQVGIEGRVSAVAHDAARADDGRRSSGDETADGTFRTRYFRLTVSHNGTPLPERVRLDEPSTLGLGLHLVTTLVEQLNGTISHAFDSTAGLSRYTIDFPLD
jgi:PAS domain S-box-containing protein